MNVMTAFPINPPPPGGALIASASSAVREKVLQNLSSRWRPAQQALSGAEALVKLASGNWQVLFLDRCLPDLNSEELVAMVQRKFPAIQVVLLDPVSATSENAPEEKYTEPALSLIHI